MEKGEVEITKQKMSKPSKHESIESIEPVVRTVYKFQIRAN